MVPGNLLHWFAVDQTLRRDVLQKCLHKLVVAISKCDITQDLLVLSKVLQHEIIKVAAGAVAAFIDHLKPEDICLDLLLQRATGRQGKVLLKVTLHERPHGLIAAPLAFLLVHPCLGLEEDGIVEFMDLGEETLRDLFAVALVDVEGAVAPVTAVELQLVLSGALVYRVTLTSVDVLGTAFY